MNVSVAKREVNPAGLNIEAPPANFTAAIEEQMRREDVRNSSSSTADGLSVAQTDKIKAEFYAQNTGFFIVHHANLEYPMRCMVPNIRFVDFFPAASQSAADVDAALRAAQRQVKTLSKNPRLRRVIHNIVPANIPHLIPYSEITAQDPAHVLPKINRNANRHVTFTQYRNEEFKKHVETKTPGDMEMSEYHRWKTYLSRRRTLKLSSPDAAPTVDEGDEITAADALREAAASGRAVIDRISTDPAHEFVPAAPLPGLDAFMNPAKAPVAVLGEEEVPAAWTAAATDDEDDTVPEWPRDLERRASFMNISIIDDLDIPSDSPAHPGAAGMEPMVIAFGAIYENEEDAKTASKDAIAPWARDIKVDTVCMYVYLFPTEVDPDKIKEEHRTGNSGNDAEMKLVMEQNKYQKKIAAKARQEAQNNGASIPEINANAGVPDLDEAVARNKPAISFAGDIVQLPRKPDSAPLPEI